MVKKIVVMLVLLVGILGTCYAGTSKGTPIPGFQDIAWGDSREDVVAYSEEKGMRYTSSDVRGNNEIICYEGEYAGESAEIVYYLYNGRMWQTAVFIKCPEHQVINKWREFKNLISDEYGTPSDNFYLFKRPYYNGDGYETQAIRLGKGTALTYWQRPDGYGGTAFLKCEIKQSLKLAIIYQNKKLADKAIYDYNAYKVKDL